MLKYPHLSLDLLLVQLLDFVYFLVDLNVHSLLLPLLELGDPQAHFLLELSHLIVNS